MPATLLAGAALLGLILLETDLTEVWGHLSGLGAAGIAALLLLYLLAFVAESTSWLLTLAPLWPTPRWALRFWNVLMVGSAIENVTPLADLGGEPVKVLLLKRHYAIPYRDGTASLVLGRTTDLMAQVLFMLMGFGLIVRDDILSPPYRVATGAGLALLALGVCLFALVQRRRVLSAVRRRLERGWLGRRLGHRAEDALAAFRDIEDRLEAFWSTERVRLSLSLLLALAGWLLSALAGQAALALLGHPVSFEEALVIEAFVGLVRSALFFVPGDVGTQEGGYVLVCAAITGSAELGLALATIRRARDILWVLAGLAIGSGYTLGDIPGRGAA